MAGELTRVDRAAWCPVRGCKCAGCVSVGEEAWRGACGFGWEDGRETTDERRSICLHRHKKARTQTFRTFTSSKQAAWSWTRTRGRGRCVVDDLTHSLPFHPQHKHHREQQKASPPPRLPPPLLPPQAGAFVLPSFHPARPGARPLSNNGGQG